MTVSTFDSLFDTMQTVFVTDFKIWSGNSFGNKLYKIILSNFFKVYGYLDFLDTYLVLSKNSFSKSKNTFAVATSI